MAHRSATARKLSQPPKGPVAVSRRSWSGSALARSYDVLSLTAPSRGGACTLGRIDRRVRYRFDLRFVLADTARRMEGMSP